MSWGAVGQQTFNRSYTYDGVNRLYTMAAPGSTCSGLSWSYDQWGNRTAQTATGGSCGSPQWTYNAYNHMTNPGYQYDAAGNMTHDASHSYTYDEENRVAAVDGGSTASYLYDPQGRRVQKVAGGVTTDYIRDQGGKVVAEVSSTCNYCWTVGYNYLGGQLSSIYTNSTTYLVSADHLGSTRLLTGYPTPSVVECDDYYPFGEQISCGGTSTTTHKFTGYERDAETGLDNAQARYNSSSLGRFMSPDPIGNFVADATNPQTWNLYAYVNNNPLAFVDPTGTDGCEWSAASICIAELDDSNFDWEGDFGFGTSYTMNGAPTTPGVAQSALSNPDAAAPCTACQSPGVGLDQTGVFQQMLRDWVFIHCIWLSDGDACMMEQKGRFHLKVANPDDVYFSSDAAQMEYTLGMAGTLADREFKSAVANMAIGDVGGAAGGVVADVARGPWESALFGRNGGFLNSNNFLRVGFGWSQGGAQNVFRITGDVLNGAHLLNWPWPW